MEWKMEHNGGIQKPLVTTKWPGPAAAETSLIKRPLTCEFMGWESGRRKNGSLRMGGRGSATRRKGQGSGSAQCFMVSRQRSTQATSRICNCRISSGMDQRISSRSATTLIHPPHIPAQHSHKDRDAWIMDSGPLRYMLEDSSKRHCPGSWTQGAKTWIGTKKHEKKKKRQWTWVKCRLGGRSGLQALLKDRFQGLCWVLQEAKCNSWR